MHGIIYQIDRKKIRKEDYITYEDIPQEQMYKYGIDYVHNYPTETYPNMLPEKMFTIKGKVVSVKSDGIYETLKEMTDTIRQCADQLTPFNVVKWETMYELREVVECYDKSAVDALFWFDEELVQLNEFILSVERYGDKKLHIGAVLDYHY